MNDTARTTYRVIQKGQVANVPVSDFDSLVTHHPGSNRSAHMEGGIVVGGERGRLHAYIGGEVEEVEVARSGRTYGLKPDQVLIKKDFILEHPAHPKMSAEARNVDVPSPVAGYVGRVDGLRDWLMFSTSPAVMLLLASATCEGLRLPSSRRSNTASHSAHKAM